MVNKQEVKLSYHSLKVKPLICFNLQEGSNKSLAYESFSISSEEESLLTYKSSVVDLGSLIEKEYDL